MMKLLRKIARKILFKKKTKIGGHDLDDKTNVKEDKRLTWTTATTSVNSNSKDIKIVPATPKDIVPKAKGSTPAAKPGRPKGQTPKGHSGAKPVKKVAPNNNTNKK